jgi:glutathione S-transferase
MQPPTELHSVERIDLSSNRQKEPWFIALNPNGRIPVLVDREHQPEPFSVFETAAILLYLVRKYDTKGLFFFPAGSDDESVMLQWIFFGVRDFSSTLPALIQLVS